MRVSLLRSELLEGIGGVYSCTPAPSVTPGVQKALNNERQTAGEGTQAPRRLTPPLGAQGSVEAGYTPRSPCLPSPPPSPATPYAAPGPTSGNPRAATNCLSADSSAGNLHSLPVKGPPPPQSPPSHQCRLLTEACVSPADPGSHGAFTGGYYVPLFLVWFSAVILYLGPFCMLWTYY